jgi:hypothetical protein
MNVNAPSGAYWTNPHGPNVGTKSGAVAGLQRENSNVQPGICVAAMGFVPGSFDGHCPAYVASSSWQLGSIVVSTPDHGTRWVDGQLYTGGKQRSVAVIAYNDEVEGHCVPLVVAEPREDSEWERCISCLP